MVARLARFREVFRWLNKYRLSRPSSGIARATISWPPRSSLLHEFASYSLMLPMAPGPRTLTASRAPTLACQYRKRITTHSSALGRLLRCADQDAFGATYC